MKTFKLQIHWLLTIIAILIKTAIRISKLNLLLLSGRRKKRAKRTLKSNRGTIMPRKTIKEMILRITKGFCVSLHLKFYLIIGFLMGG